MDLASHLSGALPAGAVLRVEMLGIMICHDRICGLVCLWLAGAVLRAVTCVMTGPARSVTPELMLIEVKD